MCFHAEVASTDMTLDILTGCLVVVGILQAALVVWTGLFIKNQVASQKKAERAWLIISPSNTEPSFIFSHGGGHYAESEFLVSIKNVGRTPAHSIKVLSRYLKLNALSDLPTVADYTGIQPFEMAILTPEDSFGAFDELNPPIETTTEYKAMLDGKLFLYSHARVEYMDIFGDKHVTKTGFIFPSPRSRAGEHQHAKIEPWGPPGYIEST